MIGDHKFKLPFLDLIPFDGDQLQRLHDSISAAGKVNVPIICWRQKHTSGEDTVVDGAHRVLIAAKLGLKIRVIKHSFDNDEEAQSACEIFNYERRHLTSDQLRDLRLARIDRIAAARDAGESLRSIADKEGISKTQVERDILGVPGGTVHTNEIENDHGPKRKPKRQPQPDSGIIVDTHETAIPENLLARWQDPWIQDTIDRLQQISATFREHKFADGMAKRAKHFPFIQAEDFGDACSFVIDYIDKMIGHLEENRPAAVCQACHGQKCGECMYSGLVPERVYLKLAQP